MRIPFLYSFVVGESGSSLVEFSLCATVLLTVIFGVMDISRALYTDHFLASAAREGARYAIVRGATFTGTACASVSTANCAATQANVNSYVKSVVNTGISASNVNVTATWPGTDASGASCTNAVRSVNTYGCVVDVKVTYAYKFILPFLPKATLTLKSSSAMTISE